MTMARINPEPLNEILENLPLGWKLVKVSPGQMQWNAELRFENQEFLLVCDRGYVNACKKIDGKWVSIEPPDDQRMRITPRQVVELLTRRL